MNIVKVNNISGENSQSEDGKTGHRLGRRKSNAPQSSAHLLDRRERERDSVLVFLSRSLAETLHCVVFIVVVGFAPAARLQTGA